MNRHKSFAFKELLLSACAAFLIKKDYNPRDISVSKAKSNSHRLVTALETHSDILHLSHKQRSTDFRI